MEGLHHLHQLTSLMMSLSGKLSMSSPMKPLPNSASLSRDFDELADAVRARDHLFVQQRWHRLVKRGRKTKVEYLITFIGYGPDRNLWEDDIDNCEQGVKDNWASKPESERLVVMLCCGR